jgi:ABC-2 type transport system permease protein
VANAGPEAFERTTAPWRQSGVMTAEGHAPLALAIYVPSNFGAPGAAVRMWTNGRPNNYLIDLIRGELSHALKLQALGAAGLAPETARRLDAMSAPVVVVAPAQGSGSLEQTLARSALPLGLAYLLLISSMTTGSMMLTAMMEERSNKLLESVLACVSPRELMYGKLLGLGAVGLTIIVAWVGFAALGAASMQGVAADVLRPSVANISHPLIIAAMIFYFLAAYLVMTMIFLGVGCLANTMQEAQAYLGPAIMIVMMPVLLMMGSVMRGPESQVARTMSWIPIYTPFAMMARLGSGMPPWWEMAATSLILLGFIGLGLWAVGRLFEATVLRAGEPPKLSGVLQLILHPQGS